MSKNFNHEGVNFVKGGPSKKSNMSNANTSSKRKFVPSNNSGGGQKSAGGSGGQKSGAEKSKFLLNKHCYVCGEPGHFAKNCSKRRNGPKEANFIEKDNFVAMVTDVITKLADLSVTMIFEVNMVGEPFSWWIDCGATVHICNNSNVFKDF